MRGTATRAVIAGCCAIALYAGTQGAGAAQPQSASGHGALNGGDRQFSFTAVRHADGTVTGQAQLTSRSDDGLYRLHVDISCMQVFGNTAFLGGTTKSTTDPNLVDAVYFSVQDNGEPGTNDKISRAFFYDDDPSTQGDPNLCMNNQPGDFPLEPIENGNIQVKPTATS